jgi:hypothetical protein
LLFLSRPVKNLGDAAKPNQHTREFRFRGDTVRALSERTAAG